MVEMLKGYSLGEITAIIIFFIGVYGIVARRNIVKSVIAFGIMEMGVILFFLSNGQGSLFAPILKDTADIGIVADPIPQALMITAIVIGVGVTAVALTMFINLYHKYGTTNWEKAMEAREKK